jgi:hypothetical protein
VSEARIQSYEVMVIGPTSAWTKTHPK